MTMVHTVITLSGGAVLNKEDTKRLVEILATFSTVKIKIINGHSDFATIEISSAD